MLRGRLRDDDAVVGGIKPDEPLVLARGGGTPGTRNELAGGGGGGISCASVTTFGSSADPNEVDVVLDDDPRRCALFSAGNAGGVSVRSDSLSESCS